MKSKRWSSAVLAPMFILLAVAIPVRAQTEPAYHHHYKIIDLGTFGGPNSYLNSGGRDLNNAGTVPASGETSVPDPFAPACFLPECVVGYAFEFHGGVRTDLGVLPAGNATEPEDACFDCNWSSFPMWIADNGLIAGLSENSDFDSLAGVPVTLGVLWRDGKIINLGTLGGKQSGTMAVNRRGVVVGTALNTIPDPFPNRSPYTSIYLANATETHAFVWHDGLMKDLGTLGGPDSIAMYVNNRGQVAGQSDLDFNYNQNTLNPTVHPFVWEKGHMLDLGGLGGTFGFPFWMNNRGAIVGWSNLPGDATAHPFLWTKEGGMKDLGTLGGTFGHADSINDGGEVVGTATAPGDPGLRAFLWRDGVMTNLGTLGSDPNSEAVSINSRGQIVGGTYILRGPDLRGFLWENGGPIVDLNDLVIDGSGITVRGPTNINDRGEIAAPGAFPNGDVHALLLIPCDQGHPDIEGCEYDKVETHATAQISASWVLSSGPSPEVRGVYGRRISTPARHPGRR